MPKSGVVAVCEVSGGGGLSQPSVRVLFSEVDGLSPVPIII